MDKQLVTTAGQAFEKKVWVQPEVTAMQAGNAENQDAGNDDGTFSQS